MEKKLPFTPLESPVACSGDGDKILFGANTGFKAPCEPSRWKVRDLLTGFTCPVCGRKKDYLLKELREGAVLTCPFCNLGLNLHGHMWEDVQKEIQKLKEKRGVKS
jgi:hypothetical protein